MDSEKVIKHLITQFCDQQFKFTINLKILGSIHVIVDNNEVLTCLFDEKYFKPNVGSGLIIPNNSFNSSSNLSIPQNQSIGTDSTLNLVNTLHQLQQQRCSSKMSVSTVTSSKLSSSGVSSKSSSSAHSSSSSSSSSSYISSVYNDQSNQDSSQSNIFKHKRKRINGQNDSQPSSDTLSISSSKNLKKYTDPSSENDHESITDEENNTNQDNITSCHVIPSLPTNLQCMTNDMQNTDAIGLNEVDSSNASYLEGQTPVKRNKLDTDYDFNNQIETNNKSEVTPSSMASDEAVAAAAATLSLISVASRTNQDTPQNNPLEKNSTTQSFISKKSKIKSIIEEYNKNEQFQLELQQQQEQARAGAYSNENNNVEPSNSNNLKNDKHHNESNSSDDQLYMDEDNEENNFNEYPCNTDSNSLKQNSETSSMQLQNQDHLRQQHQLMMAAAAAIINNNNNGQQAHSNDQKKLFMPHLNLALNLNSPLQQQQNLYEMFNNFLNPNTNSFLNIGNITSQSLDNDQSFNSSLLLSPVKVKPFSCERCKRTFNSKYNVIRHLKQYHAERRMFKCTICGRDYKWVDSLHKHMKSHKKSESHQDIPVI